MLTPAHRLVLSFALASAAPLAATGTLEVKAGAKFSGGFGLEATLGPSCAGVNERTVDAPAAIAGAFTACSRLAARGVEVAGPTTLTAGLSVGLGNGFAVAAGAELTVALDPSFSPLAFLTDRSPSSESLYKASFRLRLDDLVLGVGDEPVHLRAHAADGTVPFEVRLKRNAALGENRLVLAARNDDGTVVATAAALPGTPPPAGTEVMLPAGWNQVEIDFRAGDGDGRLVARLGGMPFAGLTTLDNDKTRVEEVDWGVAGGELPTARGKIQMDDFRAVAALAAAGPRCNPTGGSGGLAPGTHDVTLAGRPATVIVGDGYDPTIPTFLAFYLHGDEGGYNFHAQPFNVINQFVNERDWIYVAPRAPADPTNANVFPWDGRNGGDIAGNADLVAAVLDDMFAKYNVCRNLLFGGSVSGGSWFHDAYFFPKRGGQYPAFFNRCCGASQLAADANIFGSRDDLNALGMSPDIVARSELKFTIGTDDFLYPNALTSEPVYRDAGFSVIAEHLPGVGHCAFDTARSIRDYWQGKTEAEIFADGFESGDTSAWSGRVP